MLAPSRLEPRDCTFRQRTESPGRHALPAETFKYGCVGKCLFEDIRGIFRYYFEIGVDGFFVENIPESVKFKTQYSTELKLNNTQPIDSPSNLRCKKRQTAFIS